MKRYGEKAVREALNDGAIIRDWEWFTLQAGYKVTKDNETLGFITYDLFIKLLQDGTIVKMRTEYSYSDYAIVIKEKESTTETSKMKNGGHTGRKGKNNMQTKKVFSAAKYLASMMKICDDAEIQDIIIPAINPKGWVWDCDGKTLKECRDLGYSILSDWCIEIPQNENIDFWRNYSN